MTVGRVFAAAGLLNLLAAGANMAAGYRLPAAIHLLASVLFAVAWTIDHRTEDG